MTQVGNDGADDGDEASISGSLEKVGAGVLAVCSPTLLL